MIRRIIRIDEEKCNGCGDCAKACHEGAIEMINGKARLTKENYCDGLGDCLPNCPSQAISFVEREAPAYDEEAVLRSKKDKAGSVNGVCPGSGPVQIIKEISFSADSGYSEKPAVSKLSNWPVQIKLAPVKAAYFEGAELLVAADCTAFAYAEMHSDFINGKICLTGCPKLDAVDYSIKLTEIIRNNDIKTVHVVRMEVPCCGGIEFAVNKAILESGKIVPISVTTISIDGKIIY